jgi:hypothetical protein
VGPREPRTDKKIVTTRDCVRTDAVFFVIF